jgi:hypothetical protein
MVDPPNPIVTPDEKVSRHFRHIKHKANAIIYTVDEVNQ